jgi:hypothetical protein
MSLAWLCPRKLWFLWILIFHSISSSHEHKQRSFHPSFLTGAHFPFILEPVFQSHSSSSTRIRARNLSRTHFLSFSLLLFISCLGISHPLFVSQLIVTTPLCHLFCFFFRHGHHSVSQSSCDCLPVPLPSSEGCGPQDHVQRWSNVRWDERVGAWGRNYTGGDSITGSQKMCAHLTFFPFKPLPLTREWPVSTNTMFRSQNQRPDLSANISKPNCNLSKPALTSQNQTEPSANISKPNCNLSKPALTSQNQTEPSANIPKPTSDNVSKPTNRDARTQRQHLKTSGDVSKSTLTSWNPLSWPQHQHVQPRT